MIYQLILPVSSISIRDAQSYGKKSFIASAVPRFRPLLAVGLLEVAVAVADVVLVLAGEHVAGAECVAALALLSPTLQNVFVFVANFSAK